MPEQIVILTDREEAVLRFVRQFHKERCYMPSIREIGRGTGIRSTSLIGYYLDKLQQAGKIKRDPFIARSIVLVENAQ